jgi:hypothetical protein
VNDYLKYLLFKSLNGMTALNHKFEVMDTKTKEKEIQTFQNKLKAEMPRVIREIEVYEKALKKGTLKKNPIPSPQFNLG